MLDIGCGANKQPGYMGMDKQALDGVDIVHDAEVFPWPLKDESCAVAVMSHFVEHVKPWLQIDLLNEVWRVLEPKGIVMIATPYATSFGYFQDPTHCTPWNEVTPLYFDPKPEVDGQNHGDVLYNFYKPKPWKIEKLVYNVTTQIELVMQKRSE